MKQVTEGNKGSEGGPLQSGQIFFSSLSSVRKDSPMGAARLLSKAATLVKGWRLVADCGSLASRLMERSRSAQCNQGQTSRRTYLLRVGSRCSQSRLPGTRGHFH